MQTRIKNYHRNYNQHIQTFSIDQDQLHNQIRSTESRNIRRGEVVLEGSKHDEEGEKRCRERSIS